ncbi:FadR/GntR family transcriptional regulator [Lichenifustis flavocetrariae]|uniref:FadR family transcriptional regulator n=1 Tax=Lichenifustis flavocetrariae TaxID=2949735 RepID=A0AA41YTU1_9HYPH|nr:FadR/GntR family transcriptional regulator [Lichenifustis flavocetrariae]MCW6506718.1 FadR family transcriptional regulator [Lichenifustis flavocetrariae]
MSLTPTKRGEPRRLYQQVADQIRAHIRSGRFPPLSRLPAERDLAQQLDVSRPSLREALIALEIDGSVDIRMGSGIYVCAPSEAQGSATQALGESPSELMQARAAIEGATVVLACARMTPEALAELRQMLDRMRSMIAEGVTPFEHDRAFHMAIAQQAGNSVLARIVGEMFDERQSRIAAGLSRKYETPDTWIAALAEHELIYAAFEAVDPLWAQSAMTRHIQLSADRWTRDMEE